ncbi:3-hydroxyacyl-CoA dehydrogenase family protein [Modestobacter altitudinis]|uniref:3-hydroxyacyl-CoA dehydrogenase family protein n=1 Tax=Modestobacter altitudinis TaxID=2213158 RepID=UPI00110CDB25|nr:3-hydroxybutyryl-CoA dehydrogenase [Modestobacter altitudinis]
MARELSEVGVVGLGTMGAGIAEVLARAGLSVTAVDVSDDAVERGRGHLERSTGKAVARGRLAAAERDEVLARIRFSTDMADLAVAELVVEAIPERMELKARVLTALDAICPPDTILATNTSSLSVTELSVTTGRPGKVIGMHFFNPAPVMKLVEIVRTVVTEPSVVDDVEALAARLGKVGVTIGDKAGFIANALLFGYLNHAASMVEDRYASREDVDAAMQLGCGLPMGPLALLDLIGIDTAHQILVTMHQESGNRLHAPSPVIRQLMTAGLLGRKSGRGFYTYAGRDSAEVVPDAQTPAAGDVTAGARPVQRVVVVGATAEAADALLAGLPDGGRDVPVLLAQRVPEGGRGVRWTGEVDELADAELVLVAGAEEPELARDVFAAVGEATGAGAVLATTSATPPVVICAAASGRPADVIGLHQAGRTSTATLVEVVSSVSTRPDAAATGHAFCAALGVPTVSSPDRAGHVVDALLFPYLNDAVRMLEAHYATADDIDAAMELGCGYPMGPFALLDAVGLDVALAVERELYAESREPGLAPAPLLGQLVTAGRLGRTAGRGFRDHPSR